MRPLAPAQGSRRRASVSTGAVKTGMIGVLATATIAAPLAAAYADGAAPQPAAAPAQAAPAAAPAQAAPVEIPTVAAPAEVREDDDAASRSDERGVAATDGAADLSAEAPAPAEPAEADGVAAEGEAAGDITVTGGTVRPVPGPITSGYGYRIHPVLGYSKMHDGIDFGATCGTPVHAAKAGTVVAVEYHHASGKRVKVDHGNGQITGYYHLQGYNVSVGQQVSAGDVVGFVGSTGRSTGCHLHFALMDESGNYSNPATILQ